MSLSSLGMVFVFLAAFAVCAMAVGFFKAAMQQRKIDRETAKQEQAAKEQAEKERAEKERAKKKQQDNKPKVKRLGE